MAAKVVVLADVVAGEVVVLFALVDVAGAAVAVAEAA